MVGGGDAVTKLRSGLARRRTLNVRGTSRSAHSSTCTICGRRKLSRSFVRPKWSWSTTLPVPAGLREALRRQGRSKLNLRLCWRTWGGGREMEAHHTGILDS